MKVDCLIVGAGPGGLTAAIYLARFHRDIAVVDEGRSRARFIPKTHNYPGFPRGLSGPDLLERLREQAERYKARVREGLVEEIVLADGGFRAKVGKDSIDARKVILATGVVDIEPEMPGLEAAIECGCVRLCPICDGFEVTDRAVAVYGPADMAPGHALFMRTFTNDVTLLTPADCAAIAADECAKLRRAGIRVADSPAVELYMTPDKRAGVRLADGAELVFATLYPTLGCRMRSDLAVKLGARCTEAGEVVVDAHQRTSVPGLYAVGDVVNALNQIAVAVGHAAIAATDVHNQL